MSVITLNQFTRLSPYEREALLDSLWKEEEALKAELEPVQARLRKVQREISQIHLQAAK